MTENTIHFRGIRLIIDCLLLLVVILVIIASRQPSQVNAESQPQVIYTEGSLDLQAQYQAPLPSDVTDVASNSVTLDDNTIAALIAAETAALTSPQIVTSLPIISR
jgi:hypothetical protein